MNFRQKNRWSGIATIFAIVALVGLPVLIYGFQGEGASWKLAALANQYDRGEFDTAIENADKLWRKNPSNLVIGRTLARWLVEQNHPERALEICEELEDKHPNDARLAEVRINASVQLSKFDEALELLKQNNKRIPMSYLGQNYQDTKLNGLAFFRGLAKTELSRAYQDINLVLEQLAASFKNGYGTRFDPVTLAYANVAVVLIEAQEFVKAKEVLDRAIKYCEPLLMPEPASAPDSILEADEFQLTPEDKLTVNQEDEKQLRPLAVLYALRAKALEEMNQKEQRDYDLRQVMRMNYDPQILLDELPEGKLAGLYSSSAAALLDTRACVNQAIGFMAEALQDSTAAVAAARAWMVAVDEFKYYEQADFYALQSRYLEFLDDGPKKQLASVLYRRSLILEAVGEGAIAKRDQAEIRDLGYQPGSNLFWSWQD